MMGYILVLDLKAYTHIAPTWRVIWPRPRFDLGDDQRNQSRETRSTLPAFRRGFCISFCISNQATKLLNKIVLQV